MFCDKGETMKTSRLALVVIPVGLLCVGNAVGQDEQKAESDIDNSIETILAKANDGDVEAMSNLGVMYATGNGKISATHLRRICQEHNTYL